VSSASFYYIVKLRCSLVFVHFRFSEEYLLFAVLSEHVFAVLSEHVFAVLSEHVFIVVLMCFSNATEMSSGISSISL